MSDILFGGSFDPPGIHHECVVGALHDIRDIPNPHVTVIPCGSQRQDKRIRTTPEHRTNLCELAFKRFASTHLDVTDLRAGRYSPLIELDTRYGGKERTDLYHVVGSDLVIGGKDGRSEIQLTWKAGPFIWTSLRYIVVERPGYPLDGLDLPPQCEHVIPLHVDGASKIIRERIEAGLPFNDLVSQGVWDYICTHRLYGY